MKAYLTRRYWFSASHRLHNDAMSETENRAAYGKCNNPHGHGHNYALEVTLRGTVDARTGMVCDIGKSQVPALGYTVTYAVGNTLLTIWGMVIVLLMT